MNFVYLKNLEESDLALLKRVPALVTILIGAADNDLDAKEKSMGKTSTEFRKNHGDALVQDYFNWVAKDFDSIFEKEWEQYKNLSVQDRQSQISAELSKTTEVLHRVDKKYAHSLVNSWRGLARAVANTSGGFLGNLSVSHEEVNLMGLEMIDID